MAITQAPLGEKLKSMRPRDGGRSPLPIRSFRERVIWLLCLLCALVSIITTAGIVLVLAREALLFFKQVSPFEFFTSTRWSPLIEPTSYGVLPLMAGTFLISIGAGIIAIPLGLLSAIFLSEYAPARLRNVLKPMLEILAGVPTIVYGFFAVNFVTPLLQRTILPDLNIYNALSGMIVVGIMILPLVSSLCEDALSAVPKALREGAYGLGATKMEVTLKIVVPAALSGVMAAFILALSRAVGETMAVTLAAGNIPNLTLNPTEQIQTMTAFIVQISKGDTPTGSIAYQTIFAVGLTLFVITMIMNILAQRLVRRFRQVYV